MEKVRGEGDKGENAQQSEWQVHTPVSGEEGTEQDRGLVQRMRRAGMAQSKIGPWEARRARPLDLVFLISR